MANLLQYSCLENSQDRGAWQATVYGVTESESDLTLVLFSHPKKSPLSLNEDGVYKIK